MGDLAGALIGAIATLAVVALGAIAWAVRTGAQATANAQQLERDRAEARKADDDIKRRLRRLENRAMGLPFDSGEGD